MFVFNENEQDVSFIVVYCIIHCCLLRCCSGNIIHF